MLHSKVLSVTTMVGGFSDKRVERMRRATLFATLVATLSIAGVLVMPMVEAAPLKLQFQQTWGGPNSEIANGVAIGTDGNIYLSGQTNSFGAGGFDAFLLKFTPSDTLLWQHTWGTASDEQGVAVATSIDGSVYLAAQTFAIGVTGADLIKFTPDGNLVWQTQLDGSAQAFVSSVAVTPDGASVYVAGTTLNSTGRDHAILLKFSSSGTLTWQKTWGGRFDEGASGVAVAADGSVYMTGGTSSFTRNEAFLNKFNPDGTLVWERGYGLAPSTLVGANALAIAQDGSIYITGDSQVQGTAQEIFLAKFAPDGTLVSQENWAETRLGSAGLGVAVSPDGSVWVTGNTGIGAGGGDAILLHFSTTGKILNANTWGGTNNDSGNQIVVGADGRAYTAGQTMSTPPYSFLRAPTKTVNPGGTVAILTGVVGDFTGTVSNPNGVVGNPNGSLTFAGDTDAVLLKV